jgi:protein arginine N-methyltransferase 2
MSEYKDREVYYTEDGRLMDGDWAVMMDWEKPIMEFQASHVCRNGGDILNVGFGMGFIDDAIEKFKINSHHIIEIHPTVHNEMIKRGWDKKPHVKIHFGDWRDVMYNLPKFDGIYIDTWDELILDFASHVHNILKPGGVFSWFNNPKDDFDKDGISDEMIPILQSRFDIRVESMLIPKIDSPQRQTGKDDHAYWWEKDKVYNSPIFILR